MRRANLLKSFLRHYCTALKSCQHLKATKHKFHLSKPILNETFLLDERNADSIDENIRLRKGVGNIHLVHDIKNELKRNQSADAAETLNQRLQEELCKIPNDTHPDVRNYENEPKVVSLFNDKPEFKHNPLEFSEIGRYLNLLRTEHLGNFAGHKTFFLMSDLAELVSGTKVLLKPRSR